VLPRNSLLYSPVEAEQMRVDRITIFDGRLSFLIPHEWKQYDEDENYLYCVPNTESGWFRVTLAETQCFRELPAEVLRGDFANRQNVTQDTETGNLVSAFEHDSEEEGQRIHVYYWVVANVVQTDLVRTAIFSYAVLTDCMLDGETKEMVSLITQNVTKSDFDPRS